LFFQYDVYYYGFYCFTVSKKFKCVNKNLPTTTPEEFSSTKLKFFNKNKQGLSDWHLNSQVSLMENILGNVTISLSVIFAPKPDFDLWFS
jgi:hypothetical protein